VHTIDSRLATRAGRTTRRCLAAVATGALAAGCGGAAGSATTTSGNTAGATAIVATASGAGAGTEAAGRSTAAAGPGTGTAAGSGSATGAGAASSGAKRTGIPNALAFAKCMRANGVPNFPDPTPGGGFTFDAAGVDPASPAVVAAHARCRRFAPPPPGATGGPSTSPSVQAHARTQLRRVARCMRAHGIANFPDPSATRPSNLNPGEYSVITDYEGVWLLFPSTIDMQSPAWNQAAAACGPLAESFNHPHH
jgi:hypothetical protein